MIFVRSFVSFCYDTKNFLPEEQFKNFDWHIHSWIGSTLLHLTFCLQLELTLKISGSYPSVSLENVVFLRGNAVENFRSNFDSLKIDGADSLRKLIGTIKMSWLLTFWELTKNVLISIPSHCDR